MKINRFFEKRKRETPKFLQYKKMRVKLFFLLFGGVCVFFWISQVKKKYQKRYIYPQHKPMTKENNLVRGEEEGKDAKNPTKLFSPLERGKPLFYMAFASLFALDLSFLSLFFFSFFALADPVRSSISFNRLFLYLGSNFCTKSIPS